jgi:hypothetical protein
MVLHCRLCTVGTPHPFTAFLPASLTPFFPSPPSCWQIIGGSFISTGQLCSKFARYQFRPHFFQHAGFRLVVADMTPEQLAAWDLARATPQDPIRPFYETSCMDAAEPHVGDGPCCSTSRRER